jgi:CBS domain-containing protein
MKNYGMEEKARKFLWMKVAEVMKRNPPILTPETKVEELLDRMGADASSWWRGRSCGDSHRERCALAFLPGGGACHGGRGHRGGEEEVCQDRRGADDLALSLALALLFSALAYELKLAAITGAFFAGLALSGWREAGKLREEVSSIGYGFLIPLFFVWCGVTTDLHLLTGSWLALFFLAICIIDKFIGCGGGALLTGMGPRDALRGGDDAQDGSSADHRLRRGWQRGG